MEAKVTKAFQGVPDGEIYPRLIEVGETVSGDLAVSAKAAGFTEEEKPKPARQGKQSDGG